MQIFFYITDGKILKHYAKRLFGVLSRFSGFKGSGIEARPWDFPEAMLLKFLTDSKKSRTCFVIGAYHGHEVESLFKTGSVDRIILFEAEPTNAATLRKKFSGDTNRIEIVEAAVCDYDGECTFHEMNLSGNGSVLDPAPLAVESYGTREIRSMKVKAIALDTFARDRELFADVLWIDVQGAELGVLKGGLNCLRRASVVFIEVSTWVPTYAQGCVTSQLTEVLEEYGFRQTQLGTDLLNGTGNALYVKPQTMIVKSLRESMTTD